MPPRDRHESNLLDKVGDFFDDFVKSLLRPLKGQSVNMINPNNDTDQMTCLGSVHFVYGNDQLPDTEGDGKKACL